MAKSRKFQRVSLAQARERGMDSKVAIARLVRAFLLLFVVLSFAVVTSVNHRLARSGPRVARWAVMHFCETATRLDSVVEHNFKQLRLFRPEPACIAA